MHASIKTTALLLTVFFLTACNINKDTTSISDNRTETAQNLEADYIGMTVPQAQAKAKMEGVPFRITMADGEVFAVTMDYRIGRINAEVRDGRVVSYNVEGAEVETAVKTEETYDENEIAASSRGKQSSYECDEQKEFVITSGEYVSGETIVKLQADQIMFSDSQTITSIAMSRTVAASGEKYNSENGLVFWSKGESATVMQGEEILYQNCEKI